MPSELKLDGYDAVLANLAQLEANIRDKISKKALMEAAVVIQNSIASEVRMSHKNESHIRDDIQISKPKRTESGWKVTIGPGKKTAWRAKFLEFGHAKAGGGTVPAFPFMEPGLARSKPDFMRTVAGVIQREL